MNFTPEQREAQQRLHDAIEHYAEVFELAGDGQLVDDWLMIGTSVWLSRPGITQYWRAFRGGSQAPHVTAGLLRYATVHNDEDILDVGVDVDVDFDDDEEGP